MTAADRLTLFRLVAALLLPAVAALAGRGAFLALLVLALASDALDGPLARRLGQASPRGARLDSLADLALYGAVLLCVPVLWPEVAAAEAPWLWTLAACLLVPQAAAWLKFRTLPCYHTYLAKAAAAAVSLTGLWRLLGGPAWPLHAAIALAVVAAAEQLALTALLERPQADLHSLWAALDRRRRKGA
ncbi:MAG: hypothetical protein KatS3mg121_0358 [Gammaproteobacteria bacterium]|nr:MAG: hypothetical protein KatS3mg121_0358 [Gammaproteobacteria bacterium]